jgi:putative phosphoesterase
MRIAILSDIHGNLVALDAVVADARRERVEQFICLGDVAGNGPQPHQVIQRVRELGCPVVRGNTDEWFLVEQTYDPKSEKENRLMEMVRWGIGQISSADLEFIRTFQPRIEIALGNDATMLCFHGSPQSNTDTILATTPDDELPRLLGDHHATLMAGGHTHRQMLRWFKEMMIINPGSVGLPIERTAWGEYALIDSQDGRLTAEFKRVPFDVSALIRSARESGMPQFEWWAGAWSNA